MNSGTSNPEEDALESAAIGPHLDAGTRGGGGVCVAGGGGDGGEELM